MKPIIAALLVSTALVGPASAQDFLGAIARSAAQAAAQGLANRAVGAITAPRRPAAPPAPIASAPPARATAPASVAPAVPTTTAAVTAPPAPAPARPVNTPVRRSGATEKSLGAGLGRSKASPGPAFLLPAGLTLENPIIAWSPENPVDCDEKYSDQGYGTGEEVRVCLIFHNTTRSPINVTLPPGLIFVATNDDVQNGIIVQGTTIEVPAGERFFAPMFAYCVNEDRSTTGLDDRYTLGPVIQHQDFQELFAILEGKRLSREAAAHVQGAVDDVAQGLGLSAANRAMLQGL